MCIRDRATLVQMRGEDKAWEYLKKLDQNLGAYYTASSTELVKQVSTGDYAAEMCIRDRVKYIWLIPPKCDMIKSFRREQETERKP